MASNQRSPSKLLPSVSRVYADVFRNKPSEYWDYELMKLPFGNPEHYELVRKVGHGKYSDVFEAVKVDTENPCIIKVLKAVKIKKVKREMKILNNLRGGPNIIGFFDILRNPTCGTAAFAMELVNNVDYKTLYRNFTTSDIQFYMFRLLTALDYAHSNGIMHRDVKPQNVVIDPTRRILRLIDWGLADFYFSYQDYTVKVASRYFKAPELLLDYVYYDYSVDMWSYGCMLAGMVFRKEPFFQGADNNDQLVKIVKVLGMPSLRDYATKYRIPLDPNVVELVQWRQKKLWKSFVNEWNEDVANPIAIDLIDGLLKLDHNQRFTAREALSHRYFEHVEPPTPEEAGMVVTPNSSRED